MLSRTVGRDLPRLAALSSATGVACGMCPGPGLLVRFRMLSQNPQVRNGETGTEASILAGSGEHKIFLWFEMT